jgi:hypothetical protein
MNVHFRTALRSCPKCGMRLLSYTTRHRSVVSSYYGEFTAIEHIMRCSIHGVFRSGVLSRILSPYCRYANDIMIEAATKRFLDGRNCSEISTGSVSGISESQVRNLSNMVLGIFITIYEESSSRLRGSMQSYILQIDITTDSEFYMIVAVKDAVSGFALYVKKCNAESYESIRGHTLNSNSRYFA